MSNSVGVGKELLCSGKYRARKEKDVQNLNELPPCRPHGMGKSTMYWCWHRRPGTIPLTSRSRSDQVLPTGQNHSSGGLGGWRGGERTGKGPVEMGWGRAGLSSPTCMHVRTHGLSLQVCTCHGIRTLPTKTRTETCEYWLDGLPCSKAQEL